MNALIPCLLEQLGVVGGGGGLWTDMRPLPPQLPASVLKQAFLSTSLAYLLAFEQPDAHTSFR